MGWVSVANGVSGRRFLSVLKYGEDLGLGAQEKIIRAQIRGTETIGQEPEVSYSRLRNRIRMPE